MIRPIIAYAVQVSKFVGHTHRNYLTTFILFFGTFEEQLTDGSFIPQLLLCFSVLMHMLIGWAVPTLGDPPLGGLYF